MEKRNGLDQLALDAGIQPGYHDVRGVYRLVSDETRKAVLQAMGLLPEGADPESVLAERSAARRQSLLPRVLVRGEEENVHAVPLLLDPEELDDGLDYYLAADQGESFSGHIPREHLLRGESLATAEPQRQRFLFEFKERLAPGYHRLTLHTAQREATMRLIVVPSTCHLPQRLAQGHRLWGPGLQLQSLRSRQNWGIGDFGDLERFIDLAANIGADAVGLAPMHLLGYPRPGAPQPSLPSSRYFVDPLFLDPTRISDYSAERFQDPQLTAALGDCREAEEVDHLQVAKLKYQAFRMLYRDFHKYHLETGSERASEFQMFKAAGGMRLFRHAVFLALRDTFAEHDQSVRGWRQWPREFQRPDTESVGRFARKHCEEVDFYSYLLWQTELQQALGGERSLNRSLGVGLCPEIVAGADPDGAEVWENQPLHSLTATIGFPPDEMHPDGRNWRLAPPIPWRLTEAAYEPFIALLRCTMRYAGAVQVDHAMQMLRLFWIPDGGTARDGAYVQYPLEDLLGILALESRRNRCVVFARERTSGTQYFERTLREKKIFSAGFFFSASDERGLPGSPAEYPEQSVAMTSAPGLPTLAGYWEGLDLEGRRRQLEAVSREKFEEAQARRQAEKRLALETLDEEELLPPGTEIEADRAPEMSDALNRAIHRYLGRSPAQLVMVRLEDIFLQRHGGPLYLGGEDEAAEWPRLQPLFEEMADSSVLTDFAAVLGSERARQPLAHEHRGHQSPVPIIPRATYRLQLNREFTFAQAAAIVPYLAELGISHCYTSPCFAARSGSSHGYDVVNPNDFNQELGGMEGYRTLCRALKEHGMGQVMDIVPNHMGVMGSDNAWWLDVLENGPASSYAPFFDIEWEPVKGELRHKLLVPVLGEPYGLALEQGALVLEADIAGGAFAVCYYQHRFPLDPRTYPLILNRRLDILEIRMGQDNPSLIELLSLITAFGQLSPPTESDAKKIRIRRRDKEILKERLAVLAEKSEDIRRYLQESAAEYNSRTADSANLQSLSRPARATTFPARLLAGRRR